MTIFSDFDHIEVIAPNFKRRLSGVTSTIIQLVPAQREAGLNIAVIGEGLPSHLPHIRYSDMWRLWKRPNSGKKRVWHARRNVEMLAGIIMRDILRMPLNLLFTSAAQRSHRSFTKWLIKRMDHVVATSAKSAAFLDVPHTIIMHGIDTERFVPTQGEHKKQLAIQFAQGQKIIGCTGRIRHSKGTDLFVDAMLELLPEFPDWQAIITGRATAEHTNFKQALENKIAEAGLQKQVRFVGEVEDVLPWYQSFDLFVAPARNEGFGLTPLEAMATGTPVVVTDVGAFSELVLEGKTGYILPDFEPKTMSKKIAGLIKNNTLRTKLGANSRAHVQDNFALEKEVGMLGDTYRLMMGKTGS